MTDLLSVQLGQVNRLQRHRLSIERDLSADGAEGHRHIVGPHMASDIEDLKKDISWEALSTTYLHGRENGYLRTRPAAQVDLIVGKEADDVFVGGAQ